VAFQWSQGASRRKKSVNRDVNNALDSHDETKVKEAAARADEAMGVAL